MASAKMRNYRAAGLIIHRTRARVVVVNPRRACAARVRSVCLSVCLSGRNLGLQATRRLMSDINSFSAIYKGRKNNVAILLKRLRSRDMASKQAKKPICIMSTVDQV